MKRIAFRDKRLTLQLRREKGCQPNQRAEEFRQTPFKTRWSYFVAPRQSSE